MSFDNFREDKMNKQSLINFKYLYLGWYLYPLFSLVLSFIIVIHYGMMVDNSTFENNTIPYLLWLTPFFIFMLGFCFQFHLIHLLYNKKKQQTSICSNCNHPAKYFDINKFSCTNPNCKIDGIIKENEN